MNLQIDYQHYTDVVDSWTVDQPKTILLVFLLPSTGFSAGLEQSRTSSGASQFTEDVATYQVFEEVNSNFERMTFGEDTGTTQFIQSGPNVLLEPELLRMLKTRQRLQVNPELPIVRTTSVACVAARTMDPSAIAIDEEIDVVEQATPTETDRAVRVAVEQSPSVRSSLSEDLNVRSALASTTIGVVTHPPTTEVSDSTGMGGDSPLTEVQRYAEFVVGSVGGDIRMSGSGILSEEFSSIIGDSLAFVVPTAVILILFFLIFAYRDPTDLLIGVISLATAVLWTFGFMGLVGVVFSQTFIATPPFLLAVGIDFGIHAISCCREERTEGSGIHESMQTAADQLLVTFTIVTGTTVIGFAANVLSELGLIRDFGIAATAGIVFTLFIFGILLPTVEMYLDSLRERVSFLEFGSEPFGTGGSVLRKTLPVGIYIARLAPKTFLVLSVVSTTWTGYYGSDADSRFTQDSFPPSRDNPEYLELLPQQLQPRDCTVAETTNLLGDNFQADKEDITTVHVEGSLTDGGTLESI